MRYGSLLARIAVVGLTGCGSGELPSSPDLARGGGSGKTAGPLVTATQPNAAPRATTLDVRVIGSGYDAGSRAVWALNRDTLFTTTRIRTNSTTFVSSTELVANITIEADAAIDLHDVVVITAGGKKGIGLELFAVTLEAVDLGAGEFSEATAINDAGQVAGNSQAGAFRWDAGSLTYLGTLPGRTFSQARDINSAGDIVGSSCNVDGGCLAFRWRAGSLTELSPPVGYCCSEAHAVNDQGDVVGSVRVGATESHAAVWLAGATVATDIQAPRDGWSYAWDINAERMVVGTYDQTPDIAGGQGSYVWTASNGLQFLGGQGDQGEALGINDAGQIVGWALPPGAPSDLVAYIWQNGARQYLGTLGGRSSVGMDINEDGVVTGRSDTGIRRSGALQHVAFLWNSEGGMHALELASGFDYAMGVDINASGWVVGMAWRARGTNFATLWRPRPAP
jgi:probable HAF family extracellular repeat protein